MTDELHFVDRLVRRFGPVIGDDVAVVDPPVGPLLLAVDPVVEGVHFDASAAATDIGWNALARNLSDLAAMGGRPLHALVSLVVPSDPRWDPDEVMDGVAEAAAEHGCLVVGGDVSGGPAMVVTVAVTGTADAAPVRRAGARAGDLLFLTGPLGARRARVEPRLAEGRAAAAGGATAMIDVSDGLPLDLRRLAEASGVGAEVDAVPVLEGGPWDAGEDYELLFAAADAVAVAAAFERAGLDPPVGIGRCTADRGRLRLGDGELPEAGWRHRW